ATITGTSHTPRNIRSASAPSMSGRPRSRMTRSGRSVVTSRSASRAVPTGRTAWPASVRARTSAPRTVASSSTNRTVGMGRTVAVPWAALHLRPPRDIRGIPKSRANFITVHRGQYPVQRIPLIAWQDGQHAYARRHSHHHGLARRDRAGYRRVVAGPALGAGHRGTGPVGPAVRRRPAPPVPQHVAAPGIADAIPDGRTERDRAQPQLRLVAPPPDGEPVPPPHAHRRPARGLRG